MPVVSAHPFDLFAEVGEVCLHRHVVFPRTQLVVVPLPEPVPARDLEHAAAEMHADEKIRPGVGLAVDVDGELPAGPALLWDRLLDDPAGAEDFLLELVPGVDGKRHVDAGYAASGEAEGKPLGCH